MCQRRGDAGCPGQGPHQKARQKRTSCCDHCVVPSLARLVGQPVILVARLVAESIRTLPQPRRTLSGPFYSTTPRCILRIGTCREHGCVDGPAHYAPILQKAGTLREIMDYSMECLWKRFATPSLHKACSLMFDPLRRSGISPPQETVRRIRAFGSCGTGAGYMVAT